MLKSALQEVAVDETLPQLRNPLAALTRYHDVDMPKHNRELSSLCKRLSSAYANEIEEAERHEARIRLEKDVQALTSLAGEGAEGPATESAEYRSSYALLRVLLEADNDHLGLEELQIPQDSAFPLYLLYQGLLRQLFPSSSTDLPRPFEPPLPYVSLVPLPETQTRSDAIEASIGLLQPFLKARSESAYDLYDDEDLPLTAEAEARKSLATRPDVPYNTGRVVLGKRKREVAPSTQAASVGLNLSTGAGLPVGAAGNRLPQAVDKPKKVKSAV